MLRTCSLLLGRWNSRDFLKSRSKLSGAVHTRHVLGCRGRYKRWSSKYTLRDGHRDVNNHIKRGLGIKLGGGLFGLRIPRQTALSTMTREEYELEMYGHPNITNPYRECLHTHPTLHAVMANASLSLHLVVLLPRIARSTIRAIHEENSCNYNSENNNENKGNNLNLSLSVDDEMVNTSRKDRLNPLWNAVVKETIASVNSLLAHGSDNNNCCSIHKNNLMIEICFATLERSVRINITHAIDESALYYSLFSLQQEHCKGRILHKCNAIPNNTKTKISQVLIKERQRAIPLFGKQLCLSHKSPCTPKAKTTCNSNDDGGDVSRVHHFISYVSDMKNNVSSNGIEYLLRNLRTSLSNALCACVLMNDDSIDSFNHTSSVNTNNANEEAHGMKEVVLSTQEHVQLDRQNQYVRKRPLFFAFPSSLHYSDATSEVERQSSAARKTSSVNNNNNSEEEKNVDILANKEHSTNNKNNVENITADDHINKSNSPKPERRLLKNDIDSDSLNGVWALPRSSLHKLLNWHYCNQDPRAHSADAIPHDKRSMHLLLFMDASKYQRVNCSSSNNAKEYIERPRIIKSLISQYFTQELEQMGFKPLQSTTLCGTALELKEWLLSQTRQQELLKQFEQTGKVELYVPLHERKHN